ncbi:phytanoyl-CoA dioxygenase family protein, partial [Rhizobiaceae sp. 2RAB30]
MPDGATGLSAGQIAQFRRDGFLAIPRVTTDAEIAWMREVYDRLFERKPGWSKGDFFDFAGDDRDQDGPKLPQLLNPSRYEPVLA